MSPFDQTNGVLSSRWQGDCACDNPVFLNAPDLKDDFIRSRLTFIHLVPSQDTRRLLTEARAIPPLISGVMINSSTVMSESSTPYS
jgi:hypothetical protein